MAEISIIFSISVILIISPFLSRYIRIPTPAIEITLGIFGAYVGWISNFYLFELLAHVGFFYLMFMAGSEVDLKLFVTTDKKVIKRSVFYLVILYIISTLSVIYLDLNKVLIIIVPTLSVGLILALYKDYGKDTSWLNLSMLVGTMGELVSISLLTFTGAILEFGIDFELYKSIAYLFLLLGSIVIIFRALHVLFWWYPELKLYIMPYVDKEEQDIRLSMGLFSVMIAIMLWLHLEVAFGAFIAGIFIATFFEHKEDLSHKISSFGFGFLVPIFFAYIGSTFDLNSLWMDGVVSTACEIVLLMIIVRFLSSLVFIEQIGRINMLKFALSQSMPLTLMIAVATIAHEAQSIDDHLYYAVILASLVEVIVSMIGIKVITFLHKNIKLG